MPKYTLYTAWNYVVCDKFKAYGFLSELTAYLPTHNNN